VTSELVVKVLLAAVSLATLCWGIYRHRQKLKTVQRTEISDLALSIENSDRKQFKIAIVDDEVDKRFSQDEKEALLRRGFDIRYLKDIQSIQDLAKYQIVFCDIKGVGANLAVGKDFHGGIIVSELRKYHPLAYIVIYSSETYKPEFNRYFALADGVADKGRMTGEPLIELFDQAMKTLNSPTKQWVRFKKNVLGQREQYIEPRTMERLHKRFLGMFAIGDTAFEKQSKLLNLKIREENSFENPLADLTRDAAEVANKLIDLLH